MNPRSSAWAIASLCTWRVHWESSFSERWRFSTLASQMVFERVAAVRLAGGHAAEAAWQPLEVDLASFGPGPIQLRLELEPGAGEPPSSVAWWGSPRIVSRRNGLR